VDEAGGDFVQGDGGGKGNCETPNVRPIDRS
jgi:hypothetical protein